MATTSMEWRELIVPNYTWRGMTVPSDKLPALSGIANIIGNSSGDQYLAGIWLSDISHGPTIVLLGFGRCADRLQSS